MTMIVRENQQKKQKSPQKLMPPLRNVYFQEFGIEYDLALKIIKAVDRKEMWFALWCL